MGRLHNDSKETGINVCALLCSRRESYLSNDTTSEIDINNLYIHSALIINIASSATFC